MWLTGWMGLSFIHMKIQNVKVLGKMGKKNLIRGRLDFRFLKDIQKALSRKYLTI